MTLSSRIASCLTALFLTVLAIAAAPSIAQAQPFVHGDTESAAREFEAYLKAQWPSSGNTAKGWKARGQAAMKANDPRKATGFFASSVVLDGSAADTWLELARAYLAIQTEQYDEKSSFSRNAGSTAFIAYQRAKTPSRRPPHSPRLPPAMRRARCGVLLSRPIRRASPSRTIPTSAPVSTRPSPSTASACSITRPISIPRRRAFACNSPKRSRMAGWISRNSSP